jgi:hypothetical protein
MSWLIGTILMIVTAVVWIAFIADVTDRAIRRSRPYEMKDRPAQKHDNDEHG